MQRAYKGKEVSHENLEGPLYYPNNMVPLQQRGPNPWINLHALDPKLNAVDKWAKLDVEDFNGDHERVVFD